MTDTFGLDDDMLLLLMLLSTGCYSVEHQKGWAFTSNSVVVYKETKKKESKMGGLEVEADPSIRRKAAFLG